MGYLLISITKYPTHTYTTRRLTFGMKYGINREKWLFPGQKPGQVSKIEGERRTL